MKQTYLGLALSLLLALATSVQAQITLISDDYSSDTSADYSIANGGNGPGDGQVLFNYDYSALFENDGTTPLSPAPGTTDGSTRGVFVQVNDEAPADTESLTVFHNTMITGGADYTMTVDMYLGIHANLDDATEHATIGVGGDGLTPNHAYNPFTSGSGNYLFTSGDGKDSSDYRHFRDDANGSGVHGPVNQFDTDYLSPDNGTNIVGGNFPFFSEISNFSAPYPGTVGDMWSTVKVEVLQSEGLLKYYVRGGTDEFTGNANEAPEFLQIIEAPLFDAEGFVSFGLADMYASVAADPENQYAIFDNLLVVGEMSEGIPGDYDGSGQVAAGDLNLVLNNWGQDGTTPPDGWVNDFPNGIISAEELNGVLNAWGNSAALAVPEPSGGTLALLMGTTMLFYSRRWSR